MEKMQLKFNYGLIGASGRLGSEVKNLFSEKGHELVFKHDLSETQSTGVPDLIIDCSLPEVFEHNIGVVKHFNKPFIIATTGLTSDQISTLKNLSKLVPVVQSYNYSIGIQVLLKLTAIAKETLEDWDIEIVETHHRFKKINHPVLPK